MDVAGAVFVVTHPAFRRRLWILVVVVIFSHGAIAFAWFGVVPGCVSTVCDIESPHGGVGIANAWVRLIPLDLEKAIHCVNTFAVQFRPRLGTNVRFNPVVVLDHSLHQSTCRFVVCPGGWRRHFLNVFQDSLNERDTSASVLVRGATVWAGLIIIFECSAVNGVVRYKAVCKDRLYLFRNSRKISGEDVVHDGWKRVVEQNRHKGSWKIKDNITHGRCNRSRHPVWIQGGRRICVGAVREREGVQCEEGGYVEKLFTYTLVIRFPPQGDRSQLKVSGLSVSVIGATPMATLIRTR